MLLFKILMFFFMLFVFFGVSGLWHWIWFNDGARSLAERLATGEASGGNRAGRASDDRLRVAESVIKAVAVGLVLIAVVLLFLTIYLLLLA